MGTLSGGEIRISIGKNCLIGANAGTGIPLGDRCTVEAGLYITSGMVISVLDENNKEIKKLKARELAELQTCSLFETVKLTNRLQNQQSSDRA